tara:strand:- start:39332 stop:39562 length:231 start_codon:yes stop_codon:yes gene_type:complete
MLIIQKIKIMANKTLYQYEYTLKPGAEYCQIGMDEIKRRMMIKMIYQIKIEDLEKVFKLDHVKDHNGETLTYKIEL